MKCWAARNRSPCSGVDTERHFKTWLSLCSTETGTLKLLAQKRAALPATRFSVPAVPDPTTDEGWRHCHRHSKAHRICTRVRTRRKLHRARRSHLLLVRNSSLSAHISQRSALHAVLPFGLGVGKHLVHCNRQFVESRLKSAVPGYPVGIRKSPRAAAGDREFARNPLEFWRVRRSESGPAVSAVEDDQSRLRTAQYFAEPESTCSNW